jgi:hypothetical protein
MVQDLYARFVVWDKSPDAITQVLNGRKAMLIADTYWLTPRIEELRERAEEAKQGRRAVTAGVGIRD